MTKNIELARYQANGFIPLTNPPARRHLNAAAVAIVKGDVLHDDGNGFASNAAVTFDSATFKGVAAADCANSGGSAGDLLVEVYPFDPSIQYSVPIANDAVATQTAVGLNVDLEANDDIDISDAVTTGIGFKIDDIDVSTKAVAANTYGYAIGHFEKIVTES